LLQRRLLAQPIAGSIHVAISWGFAILFVATCLVAAQDYLGVPTLRGAFYLYFMSLPWTWRAWWAWQASRWLIRRYGARSERLWKPGARGYAVLWLLLAF
jgi:hypothetical protein